MGGPAADMWGVGCVLAELLYAQEPQKELQPQKDKQPPKEREEPIVLFQTKAENRQIGMVLGVAGLGSAAVACGGSAAHVHVRSRKAFVETVEKAWPRIKWLPLVHQTGGIAQLYVPFGGVEYKVMERFTRLCGGAGGTGTSGNKGGTLLKWMLSLDPMERPQSCQSVLSHAALTAVSTTSVAKTLPWVRG